MAKAEEKPLRGIDALAHDYEREPVPEMRQKSWYNVGIVWGGVAACLAALMVGGIVADMVSLADAAIAVVCGSLITTVIGAIASTVGARLNISTPMITRFAFGNWGVYIVALVLALGSYGWFAVQLGLFGETMKGSAGLLTGTTPGSVFLWVSIIIGGILMTASALLGYRALAWLSLVAVVPIVLLMIASVIQVLTQHPWSELVAHPPAHPAPLPVVIGIVGGGFMVGAVITPDVSRYAKSTGHSVAGVLLGFFVFQAVMLFMGTILGHAVGEWDVVKIMIGLGWGMVGMLVLVFAQWTTNDNNLYSAALAFSVIFRGWPKWRLTAIAGAIGIILALWGIYGRLMQWLMYLGVLIPPIAGIYVADYYLLHRGFYKYENLARAPQVRWLSFTAWVIASFIAYCTTAPPTGFGWFKITTIPPIDSFIISFILTLLLHWGYRALKGETVAAEIPSA